MILVADEGVDQPIVERLRSDGHQVIAIAELAPSLPDEAVLRIANENAAPLLTQDRDFGELVFRLRQATNGVLLVRLHGLPAAEKGQRVSAALASHGERIAGRFCVLNHQTLRVRNLPHHSES